jgi:surface polysaccharide O-acyltransferase-like enzyme
MHYDITKKTKAGICLIAMVLLVLTLLYTSLISTYTRDVNQYLVEPVLPNTMFITFAVFIVFKYRISKTKIPKRCRKIITDMGKNAFGIYLIHTTVIHVFDAFGLQPLIINPLISIPIISVLVLIVSYLGAIILRRIPIINKYVI